ncbi:MAG: class II D-tagatose-bisphosphate aldolase non-catalytic subunit [Anaerolineales bacterium]
MQVSSYLRQIVEKKMERHPPGIFSICSANPYVIRASMALARDYEIPLLVESTCNQVNQYGGYINLTPSQFVEAIRRRATELELPQDSIFLGGDHLGPSVWKNETADSALQKSGELVRHYVRAGYKKIHLDASMPCKDDIVPLPKETVAEREAQLCEAAVNENYDLGEEVSELTFVLGTEVPSPGGSLRDEEMISISSAHETEENILHTRAAFFKHDLHDAWEQTVAFVVQPGVEFSDTVIHHYDRDKARELSDLIAGMENLVFEAHSTDYQTRPALKELVEDHFAILKVGPALTFAMREALFSLEDIEKELLVKFEVPLSNLKNVLDQVMISNPQYWESHYSSDPQFSAFQRKFSYLDRCRYYWARPELHSATQLLVSNLSNLDIPSALISEYLPDLFKEENEGQIRNNPVDLILEKISLVLEDYVEACNLQHP